MLLTSSSKSGIYRCTKTSGSPKITQKQKCQRSLAALEGETRPANFISESTAKKNALSKKSIDVPLKCFMLCIFHVCKLFVQSQIISL